MKQYDKNGKEILIDKKMDTKRKAAFEAISKKAILVNMTRMQISNMPFDVQTSTKVAGLLDIKNAQMIQVRKLLFNPERLSKIRSLINDALLMVWNHTRPWDNIGYRLLPMEYYDDFNETFGKIKDEFEEAVKEFITNYDAYVKESKGLLGKAFNKNDYPDKDKLDSFFNLEINTSKFPDIDDIRLNLSGQELVDMQKEITDKFEGTIRESMVQLTALVNSGKSDTSITELIKVIKDLNITDDHDIDMQLAEIEAKMGIEDEKEVTPESMMVMDDLEDMESLVEDYI